MSDASHRGSVVVQPLGYEPCKLGHRFACPTATTLPLPRVPSRLERIRIRLTWPYIRQMRLLLPLTEGWLNRGR